MQYTVVWSATMAGANAACQAFEPDWYATPIWMAPNHNVTAGVWECVEPSPNP